MAELPLGDVMGDLQLSPGDQVDKYTVTGFIATGGMGEVYEAVHRFTKRQVALKCLQLRRAEKEDFRDRMQAEAEVLCELKHPNIVQVYDADITATGMVWMAMERLEGCTLREYIHRRGPIGILEAFRIAAEICDGVGEAHRIKVWHRDLKPENVFVTKRNEIKVLDLGTAKFNDRGVKTTDQMRLLGTPYYMSPEHLQGELVDGRTDVYALALMVYEMLVGCHPFAHGLDNEGLPPSYQIGELQLTAMPRPLTERLRGFPEYAWRIVQKGLAKAREERWTTMQEFASALRGARKRFLSEAEASGAMHLYGDTEPPSRPDVSGSRTRAPHFRTMMMDQGGHVVAPVVRDPAVYATTEEMSPPHHGGGPSGGSIPPDPLNVRENGASPAERIDRTPPGGTRSEVGFGGGQHAPRTAGVNATIRMQPDARPPTPFPHAIALPEAALVRASAPPSAARAAGISRWWIGLPIGLGVLAGTGAVVMRTKSHATPDDVAMQASAPAEPRPIPSSSASTAETPSAAPAAVPTLPTEAASSAPIATGPAPSAAPSNPLPQNTSRSAVSPPATTASTGSPGAAASSTVARGAPKSAPTGTSAPPAPSPTDDRPELLFGVPPKEGAKKR